MASQITHVVYGKKIYERLSGFSWPDFLIGTLFPDIRYVAKVDRDKLHQFNTSEGLIPRDNSFEAGKYVHWLIDEKREKFIVEKGTYDLLPKENYMNASLKLVEDELVYDRIGDWAEIVRILNNYPEEELSNGIDKETIELWHRLLKKYFLKEPGLSTWRDMILGMGFDNEVAEEVLNQTKTIKENPEVIKIIKATFEVI